MIHIPRYPVSIYVPTIKIVNIFRVFKSTKGIGLNRYRGAIVISTGSDISDIYYIIAS